MKVICLSHADGEGKQLRETSPYSFTKSDSYELRVFYQQVKGKVLTEQF